MYSTKTVKYVADGVASSFRYPLFIDFVPSHVTVKFCAYNLPGGAEDILFVVNSDLVGEDIIVSHDERANYFNTKFSLNHSIRGDYRFNFLTIAGVPFVPTVNAELVIFLEFYAPDKSGF